MRLGGPIFKDEYSDPASWVEAVKRHGYRAAYCPVGLSASEADIAAYAQAAAEADIVVAEVGAWSNPISPNEAIRAEALRKCKDSLALADKIGARCCVNIAGSRGEKWDGPAAADLTQETFDLIVVTVREIVDAVQPKRTYFTLETMPWMYPDSPDSYLSLLEAIDRESVAAHLDPVNLICSPQRYFNNADLIKECFARLGSQIKSCHAKDILLGQHLTVHLDEVRPGLGYLDYPTFMREVNRVNPDLPVMLEHLPNPEDYDLAAEYVREIARQENIAL